MTSSPLLKKWTLAVAAAAFFTAGGALAQETPKNADPNKGLKDYFKDYFTIGVAVNIAATHGADSALIVREFNSVTPENDMKMGPIHPAEDTYNWKNSDAIVDFATSHHIKVRGHNL
jgi:endo-1,4-beta-xylanase